MRVRSLALLALGLGACVVRAEVRLPHVISDHAVLQREKPVRIWGWAAPGEKVAVSLHGQKAATVADAAGAWEAWLKPEAAGGPYTLEVAGDQTATALVRKDILLGDVWVASGQSNMEFPLRGFHDAPLKDGEKEIAGANQPKLRLLVQQRKTASSPMGDSQVAWTECTPETAREFSAVAYFFGREIAAKEHVAIGLIDTTWGGTPVHAWISGDGIAQGNLTWVASDGARLARDQGRADTLKAIYAEQDAADKAAGRTVAARKTIPGDHNGSWEPTSLYNGMIAPYVKYAIKGAIWYQGESDTGPEMAPHYAQSFGGMIQDWRRQWAQGDFPFFYVQISSFSNGPWWGLVRDGQRRVLQLGGTGMAVSLDVGLTGNVHPPDKQTVAARLAQSALGMVYGQKVETASPMFVEATTEGSAMRVWFSHAEGLTSKGQPLGGFEIAGDDRKYVPATATIEKSTVVVSADGVAVPKYVRYGWAGTVTSFFYNGAGLPAGTFTSE